MGDREETYFGTATSPPGDAPAYSEEELAEIRSRRQEQEVERAEPMGLLSVLRHPMIGLDPRSSSNVQSSEPQTQVTVHVRESGQTFVTPAASPDTKIVIPRSKR